MYLPTFKNIIESLSSGLCSLQKQCP